MKLKRLAAVIGLGLMAASAAAQAYEEWIFVDDSIEFILRERPGGGFNVITSGTPQMGDIFVGIYEFKEATAILDSTGQGRRLTPTGGELTGVSVAQLKTANPATKMTWVFEPYTGGMNSILALIGEGAPSVPGGNAGGGAMHATWINDAPGGSAGWSTGRTDRNLILSAADPIFSLTTNCTSLQDCLREASVGTLFQVDGMWGEHSLASRDPNNRWEIKWLSYITDYNSSVKSKIASVKLGDLTARLSNLYNEVNPVVFNNESGMVCIGVSTYDDDGCFQVRVDGRINGGRGLQNGAIGRNSSYVSKHVQVPEPATMGLLGLGLLGLGLLRRRQG